MRRIAFAGLLALTSCNFAVKHPGITTGIVAGTMSMGTCELASSEHAKCAGLSAGIGVGLALIAGLAYLLASEEPASAEDVAPAPAPVDWSKIPDTTPTPPAPAPPPADNPMPGTPAEPTPGSGSGS